MSVKMGNIVQFIGVELLGRFLVEAADKWSDDGAKPDLYNLAALHTFPTQLRPN